MKESIRLDSFNFELRRNAGRKRISVGIDPMTGACFISAPLSASSGEIVRILSADIGSLMNKIINRNIKIPPDKKYQDGEKFLYMGAEYPLMRREISEKAPSLTFAGGFFVIDSMERGNERNIFEGWYKRALYNEIRGLLPLWAKKIRVNPSSINIKTVRSIWGSCSSKGSLTFSTRLALVPYELLEYVVVHELCHLRHMDHSDAFWEEVSGYISDFRERRKILKENSCIYRWW